MGKINAFDSAKHVIQTSYILSRSVHLLHGSYHKMRLQIADLNSRPPILIYQMGKVGSSSITHSLHAVEPKLNLYHVHYLSEKKIDEVAKQVCFPQRPIAPKDHWVSRYLRNRLLERRHHERWKIISLVREPIARNISAFFQNAHWLYPDLVDRYQKKSLTVDELIKVFIEKYPHDIPLTWFDDEPKAVLNIDVFESKFPHNEGRAVYSGESADVLLLRMEDLATHGEIAIQEFLGIKGFRLQNANVGESKRYSSLYEAFKKVIVLPEMYMRRMYDSKYAKHFYSAKELERFAEKWTRGKQAMRRGK